MSMSWSVNDWPHPGVMFDGRVACCMLQQVQERLFIGGKEAWEHGDSAVKLLADEYMAARTAMYKCIVQLNNVKFRGG